MDTNGISKLSISRHTPLKEALRKLDEGSEKILFVVDDEHKLFGALTDGDARRWILANGDLSAPVEKVCNSNPTWRTRDYDVEEVKRLMLERNLIAIPILSDSRDIQDILLWDEIFSEEAKPAKSRISIPVVIMAGGKGTRLDPFTKILPKPLIPIGDKPIISHIIDRFREYQINDFYVSVNHKARIIKAYFEEINVPYNIDYILEDKPLGTAGALKFLEGKLEGNFFVSNCDIIVEADYDKILEHHLKTGCDITMVASLKHYSIPYGVCDLDSQGNLLQIREKPGFDFLVNTGMYIINASVLAYIPKDEFFHMTDLMDKVKEKGGSVGVFPVSDKAWIDVGEWSEYKEAIGRLSF